MNIKKVAQAKAITLEKLEAAFEELKIPKEQAQGYLASHERKVSKKTAKATNTLKKADTKWEKKMQKDFPPSSGLETAQRLIRGL